jgi:hypothetical protein
MCRNLDLRVLLFYCLLSKFFPSLFIFLLSVLLSFLPLSNWFLFLSSFIFPLIFRHCFISVYLTHVISSLAYLNLLETKRVGCCCIQIPPNLTGRSRRGAIESMPRSPPCSRRRAGAPSSTPSPISLPHTSK